MESRKDPSMVITPPHMLFLSSPIQGVPGQPPQRKVKEINIAKQAFKNLVMGGIAGIIGALCTFPLDMVKTRLQNQKTVAGGELMYKNSIDCFKKIISREGVLGLYKGLPVQLVGITPEKAVKLTANDMLRYFFTNKETGEIKVYQEAISGSAAGFSQVIITNPYELIKVRMQTQALEAPQHRKSAGAIIQELGFSGLTRGAGACLLRDVPFSAIYFTLYGNLKRIARERRGGDDLPTYVVFMCSISAGTVAAASVTPADVVKTRLQVKQSATNPYKGIVDCFSRILKEEGPRALFKGTLPRVMIISPLFGITLTVYELLQGYFV